MRPLWEIADFVRRLRVQIRYGELSRAPLQLLRVELRGDVAECDWVARPPDQWDVELQLESAERDASLQALKDAIAVRDLLFDSLPQLDSAALRVYRPCEDGGPTLVITGTVSRDQKAPVSVHSVAMRAKLLGFRFSLSDGVLENLPVEEHARHAYAGTIRL